MIDLILKGFQNPIERLQPRIGDEMESGMGGMHSVVSPVVGGSV